MIPIKQSISLSSSECWDCVLTLLACAGVSWNVVVRLKGKFPGHRLVHLLRLALRVCARIEVGLTSIYATRRSTVINPIQAVEMKEKRLVTIQGEEDGVGHCENDGMSEKRSLRGGLEHLCTEVDPACSRQDTFTVLQGWWQVICTVQRWVVVLEFRMAHGITEVPPKTLHGMPSAI